jgi:hypothetical protein
MITMMALPNISFNASGLRLIFIRMIEGFSWLSSAALIRALGVFEVI